LGLPILWWAVVFFDGPLSEAGIYRRPDLRSPKSLQSHQVKTQIRRRPGEPWPPTASFPPRSSPTDCVGPWRQPAPFFQRSSSCGRSSSACQRRRSSAAARSAAPGAASPLLTTSSSPTTAAPARHLLRRFRRRRRIRPLGSLGRSRAPSHSPFQQKRLPWCPHGLRLLRRLARALQPHMEPLLHLQPGHSPVDRASQAHRL
jgi:hypothetical protein